MMWRLPERSHVKDERVEIAASVVGRVVIYSLLTLPYKIGPLTAPCCPYAPVHGQLDKTGHLSLEQWFSKNSSWSAYSNASFLEIHIPPKSSHMERQVHIHTYLRWLLAPPSLRATTLEELEPWCALADSESLGCLVCWHWVLHRVVR